MNWYKKAQHYTDIAHRIYNDKNTKCKEFLWWVPRGEENLKTMQADPGLSHSDLFEGDIDYSGRAEVCKNKTQISLVCYINSPDMQWLEFELKHRFGENAIIHYFGYR